MMVAHLGMKLSYRALSSEATTASPSEADCQTGQFKGGPGVGLGSMCTLWILTRAR